MGASRTFILSIFAWEGIFISLAGGLFGLLIGGFIAWLQQNYGFIGLGGDGSFVVEAYPIQINVIDFLLVIAIVIATSVFSIIYPLFQLSHKIKDARNNPKAFKR